MKHGWFAAIALLALLAMIVVYQGFSKSTPSKRALARAEPNVSAQLEDVSVALARSQQELAALRRTQQALASNQIELDAKLKRLPEQTNSPVDDGVLEEDETAVQAQIEQERVATRNRYAALARDVSEETRDPSWANEAESTIRRQVETLSGASAATLTSVDCRATLCRVDVSFSSADDAQRFRPPQVPEVSGGTVQIFDRDSESPRVTMYLARGGRSLRPLVQGEPESNSVSN